MLMYVNGRRVALSPGSGPTGRPPGLHDGPPPGGDDDKQLLIHYSEATTTARNDDNDDVVASLRWMSE